MISLEAFSPEDLTKTAIAPFWTVAKKSDKEITTWFQDSLPVLEEISRERIYSFIDNVLWYTGEIDRGADFRIVVPGKRDQVLPRRAVPFMVNHLWAITEQRVSRLSSYKPSFDTLPANSEYRDKINAKLMKIILDNIARKNQLELMMILIERWCAVYGEIYFGVEWNDKIGDKKSAKSEERVGDVEYCIKNPAHIFPEPKRFWKDVGYLIEICEIIHVEEARVRYGVKSLEPDKSQLIYGYGDFPDVKREDEVIVYRIIGKPSEFLPDGAVVKLINGKVVEKEVKNYPYSHNDFPYERHTDIDIMGRLFPISFYHHLKPLQYRYNRLSTMIDRNITLTAHPKWFYVKGSVNPKALANIPATVPHLPGARPELVTFNSVPQDVFGFREGLRSEMIALSGNTGISTGDVPPGTRSARQLAFFEEQEQKQAGTQITKHNELIRRIIKKTAGVVGDYYPVTSKDRMIRVLGRENEHLMRTLGEAKFSSEYEIIIQNSSAFSESKSARKEEVAFIRKELPGLLTLQQEADVLELGNPEKFYDIATASLKQAEAENEFMYEGKEVAEPKEYQDLIVHWQTHALKLQSFSFEQDVPQDIKELFFDHIRATEELMYRQAEQNITFAQQLLTLPLFPMIYKPEAENALTAMTMPPPAKQGSSQEAPSSNGTENSFLNPQINPIQ